MGGGWVGGQWRNEREAFRVWLYVSNGARYPAIAALEADDFFGVFEWDAGGIVHRHLLRWLAGRGRFAYMEV